MPTLNIEGKRVTVDDSFLKLSPEQQNATVQDIAKQLGVGQAKPEQSTSLVDRAKQLGGGLVKGLTGGMDFAERMLNRDAQMNPGERPTKQLVEKAEGAFPTPKDLGGRVTQGVGEAIGNPTSYIGPGGPIAKIIAAGMSGAGAELGGELTDQSAIGRTAGSMLGGLTGWTKFNVDNATRNAVKKLYVNPAIKPTPREKQLMEAIILGDDSKASKLQILSTLKDAAGTAWTATKFARRPLHTILDVVLKQIEARNKPQVGEELGKLLGGQNRGQATARAVRAGAREGEQQYGGVE